MRPSLRLAKIRSAAAHHLVVQTDVTAGAAAQRRNRHAPRALAREAPVGPGFGHVADTVARPRGNPLHGVDFLDYAPAQSVMIDAHEPLLGGKKNQRILAAPAMRIAVRELVRVEQRADCAQFLDDRIVGLEDVLPRPFAAIGGELARRVDRRKRLQPVLRADHEIFVAVPGRGMHEAGAGVRGDVIAVHQLDRRGRQTDGGKYRCPSSDLSASRSSAMRFSTVSPHSFSTASARRSATT